MTVYYNEFNPKSAAALRALIEDGFVADGIVDERSIEDVTPEDLKGFTQHHFFAGVGGWSIAARLAGWPDDRPLWTGSCPCQSFSDNGEQKGMEDERDLWPVWFRLMRGYAERIAPLPAIFGEQVENAISFGWFDRMQSDLEMERHAVGMAVLPACSVNAPHRRYRLGFAAYPAGEGSQIWPRPAVHAPRQVDGFERLRSSYVGNDAGERFGEAGHGVRQSIERAAWADAGAVGDADDKHGRGQSEFARGEGTGSRPEPSGAGLGALVDGFSAGSQGLGGHEHGTRGRAQQARPTAASGLWDNGRWIMCADGRLRRIPSTESDIQLLAYGVSERVGLLHAAGNAIVPEVFARFILAAEAARGDM